MEQGTVKWFNRDKGYGFIAPDHAGPDIYVHHSQILASGFRELQADQRVEFQVGTGPKGPVAEKVRRL